MAIGIQNYNGQVEAPNSNYPSGNIKDDTGSGNGTEFDVKSNGDIQQFFARMISLAGFTANGRPDNLYNGYQFVEAMQAACFPGKMYKVILDQNGSNDPSGFIGLPNTLGNIIWTRNSVGSYNGALIGSFPIGSTQCIISGSNLGFTYARRASMNAIIVETRDYSGTLSDGILIQTGLQIFVFDNVISI